MKKQAGKTAILLAAMLVSGCIVQSFYPVHTDKSKVALPQLNGEWDAITIWGDKVDGTNLPAWKISDNQIVAYGNDSQPSEILVTFFKLGQQLFCDSVAGENKLGWYWAWHVRRVHTVTKVETNGDLLTFKPLDLDWLTNAIASGKVSLPRLTRAEDDNWPLFTATPADWENFLTVYGSDTNAFPVNHLYILKRHESSALK